MKYSIEIDKVALKFLLRQPQEQRERILDAINKLPDSGDIKKMQGRKGYFRLRVGTYRIIYTVNHGFLVVHVIDIGNCGDVYK